MNTEPSAVMSDFHFDNSYRRLAGELFAEVAPTPVAAPKLLLYNQPLGEALGLPALSALERADYFSGNRLLEGAEPLAQAYSGHQFGHAAMLGDGRGGKSIVWGK